MAVTFESATIVVEADAAVDYVNLGFDGATHLPNDGKAHGPLSGISSQALVFYTSGETHPPKTFYAAKPEVVFSSDTVHLTEGGPADRKLTATDENDKTAHWESPGL